MKTLQSFTTSEVRTYKYVYLLLLVQTVRNNITILYTVKSVREYTLHGNMVFGFCF